LGSFSLLDSILFEATMKRPSSPASEAPAWEKKETNKGAPVTSRRLNDANLVNRRPDSARFIISDRKWRRFRPIPADFSIQFRIERHRNEWPRRVITSTLIK